MTIKYQSASENKLNVTVEDSHYSLFPEESAEIDAGQGSVCVDFAVPPSKPRTLFRFLLHLPVRILLGLLNILIMNVDFDWTKKIDPFSLSCRYPLPSSETVLHIYYQPSRYWEKKDNAAAAYDKRLRSPCLLPIS